MPPAAWFAVTVQAPTPTNVTVLPLIVHTPAGDAVNVTGTADGEDADTENVPDPNTLLPGFANAITGVAGVMSNDFELLPA